MTCLGMPKTTPSHLNCQRVVCSVICNPENGNIWVMLDHHLKIFQPNIAIRCCKCWAKKTPPTTCSNPWLLVSTPLVVEIWGARLCPNRSQKKWVSEVQWCQRHPSIGLQRPEARNFCQCRFHLANLRSTQNPETSVDHFAEVLGPAGRIADEYFVPHPNRTARKDRYDYAFSLRAAVSVSITTSRTFVCVGSRPRTIHRAKAVTSDQPVLIIPISRKSWLNGPNQTWSKWCSPLKESMEHGAFIDDFTS